MKKNSVGIIGAGQLGMMLAQAMQRQNISCVFYDSQSDACGRRQAPLINAPFDDTENIDRLIDSCSLVTCEFENVPKSMLAYVESKTTLRPSAHAFAIAADRLEEKKLFASVGIKNVQYRAVSSWSDMRESVQRIGLPVVIKARSGGYDGKRQRVISASDDLEECYDSFVNLPCIVEQQVIFREEVSCIVVRSANGDSVTYPLIRNTHKGGILRVSLPVDNHPLQLQAQSHVRRLAEQLDYVGTLTVEFFVDANGLLIANEMAPRVHNSGHWTIEGAKTSQFENHIRAIRNQSLGATDITMPVAMINLLGRMPEIANSKGVFLHNYHKQLRPKRKVGHITVTADDHHQLRQRVERLFLQIYGSPIPANWMS